MRKFYSSAFSCISTKYRDLLVNLRFQCKCGEIQTRKNLKFEHLLHSGLTFSSSIMSNLLSLARDIEKSTEKKIKLIMYIHLQRKKEKKKNQNYVKG